MVESQITASYWARFASLNCVLSSVASTAKPLAAPSSWIAVMPAGIESCRKPAVSEKTSTLSSGSLSTVTVPVMPLWNLHRNV